MRRSEPRDLVAAGVLKRCVAWALDVLLVVALIFMGAMVSTATLGPTVRVSLEAGRAEIAPLMVVVHALFATAFSAFYFVVPWRVLHASFVQRLFGLQVCSASGGGALSWRNALARWVLLFPPFGVLAAMSAPFPLLGSLLWGGAPLWYLFLLITTIRDPTGQGLHDRIVGSLVRTSIRGSSADVH